MLKSKIRENSKKKRQELSIDELEEKSWLLLKNLWESSLLDNIKVLHLFLPIKKFKEPNTWLLINRIWQEQPTIRLVVSKTDMQTNSLKHYFLEKNTPLQENAWGISEPEESQATICPVEQIELVLVPLLAFDSRGYRVGYGKGFYDRFLAQCPRALKVGFSLEEALEEDIKDIDDYDIALDYCVTPTQVISFVKS